MKPHQLADRPTYSAEEAERRYPGALASFPGGDLAGYVVGWSFPSLRSSQVDGILVLPNSPKTGYLYYNGKWRTL